MAKKEYPLERLMNIIQLAMEDETNQDVTVFYHRDSYIKIIETEVEGSQTTTLEQKIDLTPTQTKE